MTPFNSIRVNSMESGPNSYKIDVCVRTLHVPHERDGMCQVVECTTSASDETTSTHRSLYITTSMMHGPAGARRRALVRDFAHDRPVRGAVLARRMRLSTVCSEAKPCAAIAFVTGSSRHVSEAAV